MYALRLINNIKMKQKLDLQGCSDLKKLGDYIAALEVEAAQLKIEKDEIENLKIQLRDY